MKPKKLKGIGGWLIVYLIALIISLISFSAVFFTALNYVLISPSGQLNPVLVLMGGDYCPSCIFINSNTKEIKISN